jgi:hypothetical protein
MIQNCPPAMDLHLSVTSAMIRYINNYKKEAPMDQNTPAPTLTNEYYMTREFLERQISALQESIEKKDAYIIRLQDDVSQKSSYAFTVKAERDNLINTLKEYVIESVRDREMMQGNAEAIAEICGFELTKTLTVRATVDFEVEIEVPYDTDADDVISSLEFSVDAFDYSIDDFSVETQSTDWEENIS